MRTTYLFFMVIGLGCFLLIWQIASPRGQVELSMGANRCNVEPGKRPADMAGFCKLLENAYGR